jgi:23S rRNA (guanosine2251-2'-O)-methyltransferase
MYNEETEKLIIGKNAISEYFESGRPINSILIAKGKKTAALMKLVLKAKELEISIKTVDTKRLDMLCRGGNHQGIIATAAAQSYASLEDIFNLAYQRKEPPFLLIADEIEDPHNLGAIIRTAECAGVHGIIIPKRRSPGLNFTVGKASAGAIEHILTARVTNLSSTVDSLKQKGIWVYGADTSGCDWGKTDFRGPVALIVGNEGRGISRILKEKCDMLVSLPVYGKINSLNVSVAAGIFLYEIAKQRANNAAR